MPRLGSFSRIFSRRPSATCIVNRCVARSMFVIAMAMTSLVLFTATAVPAAERSRPNVVLFLVDDMGWMDCGAYGSKYYATPNIDAFAQRAVRFTNAYSQPLCSPTRASPSTACRGN